MPFHKRLLPILTGAAATFIGGPALGALAGAGTAALLGNGGGAQITPSIQPLPVGQPVTLATTFAPDPLFWNGQAFTGSDSAQRRAASDLFNTLKISPEEIIALHNSVGKANFVTEARKLQAQLVTAAAPMQAQLQQQVQQTTAPLVPVAMGAPMPLAASGLPIQPAAVGALVPIARAGLTGGFRALVRNFSSIMNAVGITAGLRAISTWVRGNPGQVAIIAAGVGLTADQLLEQIAAESIAATQRRDVVLLRSDLKGFEKTVKVAKKLGVFTRSAPARRASRRIGRHRHRVKSF